MWSNRYESAGWVLLVQVAAYSAGSPLRSQLRDLSTAKLIDACLRFRPDTTNLGDPAQAAKLSLRSIATRARALDAEPAA